MFFFFFFENAGGGTSLDTTDSHQSPFEKIKHLDENGDEYWSARELQTILGYSQWRRFEDSISRAKIACETVGFNVSDHFADSGKMVKAGVINHVK